MYKYLLDLFLHSALHTQIRRQVNVCVSVASFLLMSPSAKRRLRAM